MKKINKTFIIDSVSTAMIASLIIQEFNDIDLIIYEKKRGVTDNLYLDKICPVLYPNISDINYDLIEVESPFFIDVEKSFIGRILAWRDYRNKIICNQKKICQNKIYVGAMTSGVMLSLVRSKRIFVDHGISEYSERAYLMDRKFLFYWRKIKIKIKKMLGVISHEVGGVEKIITMCKMSGDWALHLDYTKLVISDKIKKIIEDILLLNQKKVTLFLATGEALSEAGAPVYSGAYDAINLMLIKRHANPGDFIIIKFHGSLYFSGIKPKTRLIQKLKDDGYNAQIFDEYLPVDMAGKIPAEVIVNSLPVEKVICESSSTVFNIQHTSRIRLISDFSFSKKFQQDKESHFNLVRLINNKIDNKIEIYE